MESVVRERTDIRSADLDLEDILTEGGKPIFLYIHTHLDAHGNIGLE